MVRIDRKSSEYRIWYGMIARCTKPSAGRSYERYGGRGIRVCDEWNDGDVGFLRFLAHVGARPSTSHSIDRIDNDGHYEPGNVRWATMEQQAANTRRAHNITVDGEVMPIRAWARRLNVSEEGLRNCIIRWGEEGAVREIMNGYKPAREPPKLLTFEGKTLSLTKWSRELGIGLSTISARLNAGKTVEEVLAPLHPDQSKRARGRGAQLRRPAAGEP